ncbi:MotA/TolQ/ExbB proton channel family protein [Calidifontimicrobium sp. SYSU G02091]|uniref:MotA/TolQ/ExbB proton channel family protein n=1 Tax=Calidifontimicrobium sp. SYSU G02091 TaxID=2926421 RepID=UPI001F538381|nr:MotA/TolQ/ExbB proton channel family protein [Calidifontimicrobium sp. SYSU G02091]MCI1191827.1 MotA/TolQ/ExbB proton channel family protein [Calidifontimicrobium sp. SYSU G02091]
MPLSKTVRATLAALLLALTMSIAAWPPAARAQTAPAPATAPLPPPPLPDTVVVDNPYGLQALWAQGDWVAKATLLVLLAMSVGSWWVIVVKLVEQRRLMAHAAAAQQSFWRAPTLADAARALPGDSALRFVAEQGLKASEAQAGTLVANVDRPTWIATSVQRAVDAVQLRLQNGLALLATVGSTAPFVGLFGTVWGIYHALVAIGVSGQASIDKVAGPVGEALIMTAIGLAVAVPAVIGYNALVRRNKVAMEKVRAFGADLQQVLLAARP